MGAGTDWNLLRSKVIEASDAVCPPYSRFRAGAASSVDGAWVIAGCNVENVSYGLGLCAERGVVRAAS
jgi:cytidine deaminase